MKKYVLIYAYTNFSNEETEYWNKLSQLLLKESYSLIILAPSPPKIKFDFLFCKFSERLDQVDLKGLVSDEIFNSEDYARYVEREEIWFGKGKPDRLLAAKVQNSFYKNVLDEANPAIVIMANGQHAGELIFKDEILKREIPLIYFERGCIPKTWHLDDFGVTAGTQIASKSFEELENLGVSSFVKYKEHYLNEKYSWWSQPKENSDLDIRTRFNVDKKLKIILFVNQLDNDTSNFLYSPFFANNVEAFKWFVSQIENKDCFILAKKHPWYSGDSNAFNKVIQDSQLKGAWVEDISLFDCLKQTDLVCAVNSSVIYESMMYEKPTLQLGQSIISNKDILYELNDINNHQIIETWYQANDFKNRLNKYGLFMNYMIERELSFFSKDCLDMGFNSSELFFKKIMDNIDHNRKGNEELSFLEDVEIQSSISKLKSLAKRAVKRVIR